MTFKRQMLTPRVIQDLKKRSTLGILFFFYIVFMTVRANNEYWNALENEFLLEEKTNDLEKISQRDGLTGLYNRRYFDLAFELEWRRGIRKQTRIVMMICDIDNFNQFHNTPAINWFLSIP